MKVFDKKIAPSTVILNDCKEGLSYENVKILFNKLKNKINFMDITSFDDTIDSKSKMASRLTGELAKSFITNIFSVIEKKINIFNENSRFLIYRPRIQKSEEDVGWYIVRFMDQNTKEQILSKLKDDTIIYIEVDDEEIMITTSNVDEQNQKSYYVCQNIDECCLFPQEKMLMCFELIN
jgi:hypothetical protein